jgi:glutamate 5-kinase
MTSPLSDARRIVVKTGSSLITDENGAPRSDWLASLASDIALWRKAGRDVLLVTSGAVALGRPLLGSKGNRLDEKQAAAALGQPRLMNALGHAFATHNLHVAQALLTPDDTEHRRRWLNARATLETLLEAGMLPIINENDTVATEEIRYGDNDRLAARVAQMVSADVLILLSDVDGLYTANPDTHPTAEHIPLINELTPDIEAMAEGANHKGLGSGGMTTKLAAARIAQNAGCATAITLGTRDAPLTALEKGARASWVLPAVSPDTARKAWLKGHLSPEGTLTIDDGAVKALLGGASLLPIGVKSVSGQFERGAALAVQSETGTAIAKGITAYSAADIRAIAGHHTDDIPDILGNVRRPAIIHRNDIALEN